MATVQTAPRPHDRHSRSRPFTKWMKRLASLKNPSGPARTGGSKRDQQQQQQQQPSSHTKNNDKSNIIKNNPYPVSGKPNLKPSAATSGNGHLSFYTPPSGRSINYDSPTHSKTSIPLSHDGQQAASMIGQKSVAPTVSTNPDTTTSDGANSKPGTIATAGGAVSTSGMGGGEGSTFTSPAPSIRSLTTTLTTVQSAAPSNLLAAPTPNSPGGGAASLPTSSNLAPNHHHHHHNHHGHQHSTSSHFTHQFPSTPIPASTVTTPSASAIPSHMATTTHPSTTTIAGAGPGHPTTYTTATANNVLTDNASILTLASSSKRRRRNSLDTNASVRALAPSSLFGGSRESLPLSILSANITDQSSITGAQQQSQQPTQPPQQHGSRTVSITLPKDERASVYSSSGIAPAGERNSYYASKKSNAAEGDGASVKSGLVSHGRNDSITRSIGLGSVGGGVSVGGGTGGGGGSSSVGESPLASPSALQQQQSLGSSRRHSGWGAAEDVSEEGVHGDGDDNDNDGRERREGDDGEVGEGVGKAKGV